jgi:hypothetical protein
VFAQQRPQFILKSHLPVMFLLAGNVFFNLFQIRLTDLKVRIASLPFEAGVSYTFLLQPLVGDAFDFFHPLGLGNRAAKTRQDVNVIFDATDEDRRTIQPLGNLAQIRVQRRTKLPGVI